MGSDNGTINQKKALIIGAGMHGSLTAIELSKIGFKVTVIDKNKELLGGASHATHNRIHMGYHYPRSSETIEECKQGHGIITSMYADCLSFPDFYYLIAKEGSHVNKEQYEECLSQNNLEINEKWPTENFINKELISGSYITAECCYDKNKIVEKIKEEFDKFNISFEKDFDISRVSLDGKNKLSLFDSNGKTFEIEVDLIVNCTYAFTNNIQKIFGVKEKLRDYKHKDTEIIVVKSELDIPGLTVMDGPFITILPYVGKKGHYLIYDVINSIRGSYHDETNEFRRYNESNWPKIREKCKLFFPFYDKLEYVRSLYSSRPVLKKDTKDNRKTNVLKHDYPIEFYSICEGKFCTAPMIGIKFAGMIKTGTSWE